jgi:CheY-like chemotaxis protein
LVEDDVYIQYLLESELEEAGFEVAVASNGMRAIAALEADPTGSSQLSPTSTVAAGRPAGTSDEEAANLAFTIEYSARTAREAIHCLLRRGPAPRPFIRASTIRRRGLAALKTLA